MGWWEIIVSRGINMIKGIEVRNSLGGSKREI